MVKHYCCLTIVWVCHTIVCVIYFLKQVFVVHIAKKAPSTPSSEELSLSGSPVDIQRREEQREKQIALGLFMRGYWVSEVLKDLSCPELRSLFPQQAPSASQKCTKKQFGSEINKWKFSLHCWDNVVLTEAQMKSQKAKDSVSRVQSEAKKALGKISINRKDRDAILSNINTAFPNDILRPPRGALSTIPNNQQQSSSIESAIENGIKEFSTENSSVDFFDGNPHSMGRTTGSFWG